MGNEPPVLIGFMGDRVPDDDQTHAEALSKFGGMPVWIDGKVPKEYPFTCSTCGADLGFVCQVATPYCANKRCLYLFGCHKQTDCGKSSRGWKVVRGVVEPEAPSHTLGDSHEEEQCECANEQQDRIPAGSSDWLEAAFGSRATGNSCCGTMHNKQKFKACRTWAASSSIPLSSDPVGCGSELMPPFFVNVEGEPPDNSHLDATGRRARELQVEYERREKEGSVGDEEGNQSGSMEEAYEESPDKIFLKLQKRLSRSPTQVIRYSFGGKPLFISAVTQEEQNRLGPCPHCHGDRVFEMQLVPAAADEILRRRHSSAGEPPVEWGVVAVFTCKLAAQSVDLCHIQWPAVEKHPHWILLDRKGCVFSGKEDCVPTDNYTLEHVVVQEIL